MILILLKIIRIVTFIFVLVSGSDLCIAGQEVSDSIPVYTYVIINSYPHDHTAYTQGLVYDQGFLYESTGRRGESTLRKVDLQSGAILQYHELADSYFGEGITLYHDKIIQLTWESFTAFVYDRKSLLPIEEFYYNSEGWGLTCDGKHLIMSDGSAIIRFLEPETYATVREITVTANDRPVINLNELEYVKHEILANVMPSNRIARIDPTSGRIKGWIDLSGILNTLKQAYAVDVLNGIAYDATNDRLFVTGKLWPKIYEIKIIPAG